MTQLKYTLGILIGIPCLPFLLRDGKRIKASIPQLPEADKPRGVAGKGKAAPLNLLALGESTIAGVGVKEHKNGVAGTLATYLSEQLNRQVNWKVVAKNGYTMQEVLEELLTKIGDFQADIIVIGMGGNDSFQGNSPAQFAKYAAAVTDKLQLMYPDAPIVFMNMPPIKEFPAFTKLIKFFAGNLVELHGQALSKKISTYDKVYFMSELITFDKWINKFEKGRSVDDFFSDGVHPSQITYEVWAKETGKYIVRNNLLKGKES